MKKLYIHFGLHKTGSTSIQNYLLKHADMLRAEGVLFPLISAPDGDVSSNHSIPLKYAFSDPHRKIVQRGGNQWPDADLPAFFLEKFQKLSQYNGTMILSAEAISTMSESELRRLKHCFEQWDLSLIGYVRHAYSYHCSSLQERVKAGNPALDDKKFSARSDDIKRIIRVFGQADLAFFGFADVCKNHGGPVQHFLKWVGVAFTENTHLRTDNVGMGNIAVRVANEVNRVFPLRKNGRFNPDSQKFNALNLSFSEGRFLLTDDEYKDVKEHIEVENNALSALTGLDFTSEKINTIARNSLTRRQKFILLSKLTRCHRDVREIATRYLVDEGLISASLARAGNIVPSLALPAGRKKFWSRKLNN